MLRAAPQSTEPLSFIQTSVNHIQMYRRSTPNNTRIQNDADPPIRPQTDRSGWLARPPSRMEADVLMSNVVGGFITMYKWETITRAIQKIVKYRNSRKIQHQGCAPFQQCHHGRHQAVFYQRTSRIGRRAAGCNLTVPHIPGVRVWEVCGQLTSKMVLRNGIIAIW